MQVTPPYGVSQGFKGATSPVARQVAPRPGVSTSNLDLSGRRVVKRGCVVSYHGLRCKVDRVRLGFFWGRIVDVIGQPIQNATFSDACARVQVVA